MRIVTRRMISIGLATELLLLALFSSATTTEQAVPGDDPENLLINAGFESGDGARPTGWRAIELPGGEGTVEFAWDDVYAQRGGRSLRIDVEGTKRGIWSQRVPVDAGTVYEVAGMIAFEDLLPRSDAHLQIVFRDSDGRILEFVNLAGHNSGSRNFDLDFPARMLVRAPDSAADAEVNGILDGAGTLWMDDLSLRIAPVGSIRGVVMSEGQPVEDARVYVWGDPWGEEISTLTSSGGSYELLGIPVSHPRYIVIAEKEGLLTQPAGDIDIISNQATQLDFEMVSGTDPIDTLKVGYGFLSRSHVQEPEELPVFASFPERATDYPEVLQPYLASDTYITTEDPVVQSLAADILHALPSCDQDNVMAVARAVFDWISTNINHDAVYGNNEAYLDVTSGIWQTIQPGGWCWGRSFYDWLYCPAELLAEQTGICIEHSWLSAALLRALNIPARARVGSAQFWADTGEDGGTWFGFSTNGGSNTYRETGRMGVGFGGTALPTFFAATSEPFLQEDWDWDAPGLWRERHPWGETYPGTSDGLAQATNDLRAYGETGIAQQGQGRGAPGVGTYEIDYAQIELGLWNLGDQRVIDVRFPAPTVSVATSDTGIWEFWINHPECVVETYEEVLDNLPSGIVQTWRHIVFDVSGLLEESD
jgi:transglutaminase-like putative cysteine protease